MSALKDLTGETFGHLTVTRRVANSKKGLARWECHCACGKICICDGAHLRAKHTQSCGCIHSEVVRLINLTHNKCRTQEYHAWENLRQRCNNPKNHHFVYYGGRGIKIFPPWVTSFPLFYEHIGPKPTPKHTIERIDNDGNYEPGNVRWGTQKEQQNNKRTNRVITFSGKTLTLTQWAKERGMSEKTLRSRIFLLGWPVNISLDTLVKHRKPSQSHIPASVKSPPP